MDLSLTPEHADLRQLARNFADDEIAPHAAEWDRRESLDLDLIPRMGELGFLGLTIPEEHGGSGGDHLAYYLVLEELGRADSSVRGVVSVSLGLVAATIARHGTPEQHQRWLPALCSGRALGCFALTEPGSGSDAGALTTRAVRDGDDWLITGAKTFITNGTWADVALLLARTSDDGSRGITAFLVPTASAGFHRREIHGKLGLRAQATAELHLDGVRVPDTARLGEVGRGFPLAMSALGKGRVSVAAGCVGIAQASLDAALRYAGERHQFGKAIAGHQLVQRLLATTAVDTAAARLLVWQAADLLDRGQPHETAASMAKLFASEAAVRAADNAVQVFGGYGYVDEYPVSRYLRDARVTTLYEGTSQIQQLVIGRSLTGVAAFS
ncbi:acyl-CoA dehydrogenase family protein [Actinoalloteichus caeruleus]|uniref:acyl-CoA dehydrogenase family protein n=1 Tax=Actinoalloteichus cyanogriseus TaxID=2893586 RepID=UPI0004AB69B8|nr:acyl-CoA dehydrogenase family protein [Actinoalloteichus caeruleus]